MLICAATFLLLAAEPAVPAPASPTAAPVAVAPAPAPAPPDPAAAAAADKPAEPVAVPLPPPQVTPVPAAVAAPEVTSAEDANAPMRVTLSLGLERAMPGGSVYEDFPMNDLTSPLVGLRADVGVRITPSWMVGLGLDLLGGGTPGFTWRFACSVNDVDCTVSSVRLGLEGRYVFDPTAERTWWVGAGLGSEATRVSPKDSSKSRDFLPTYAGGIFPRLSTGWDRRMSRTWGWGFYGAASWGSFQKVAWGDSSHTSDLPASARTHSWLDLGVRIILFP